MANKDDDQIKIIFFNMSDETIVFIKGDRICQLLIVQLSKNDNNTIYRSIYDCKNGFDSPVQYYRPIYRNVISFIENHQPLDTVKYYSLKN